MDRLVLRRQHLLAIRIAQFLLSKKGWYTPMNPVEPLVGGRSPEADEAVGRILAHWACYKVPSLKTVKRFVFRMQLVMYIFKDQSNPSG